MLPAPFRNFRPSVFDDRFFDPFQFFGSKFDTSRYVPSLDISETDNIITIRADVPGYDPKNIKVHVDQGLLTIEGTMEDEKEQTDKTWYRKECSAGSFTQSLRLPRSTDESKVDCVVKNGTLIITIPKSGEQKKKEIPVKAE